MRSFVTIPGETHGGWRPKAVTLGPLVHSPPWADLRALHFRGTVHRSVTEIRETRRKESRPRPGAAEAESAPLRVGLVQARRCCPAPARGGGGAPAGSSRIA